MSCPPQSKIRANVINDLANDLHALSREKGFWPNHESEFKKELKSILTTEEVWDTDRKVEQILELAKKHKAWDREQMIAQKLLLEITEISEAYESLRKGNLPDEHVPSKPSFDIELADGAIRHLDLCVGFGIDIGDAIIKKREFNKTRGYLHGKAF